MIATEVVTPFFVPMKVAMMAAFIITLPHTLYQIWAFVAPGLYSHEKRLVLPLVFTSSLLFICGMGFAYFAALPVVFEFITQFAPEGVAVMTDIGRYLDFVLTMFIAFGITFEVPILVVILVRAGIVSIEKLKAIRRYVLVGAFVIGAIFTPGCGFAIHAGGAALFAVRIRHTGGGARYPTGEAISSPAVKRHGYGAGTGGG